MPLTATPAQLAPHGTWDRAQVCSKHCNVCSAKRTHILELRKARQERDKQASREGKAARGR